MKRETAERQFKLASIRARADARDLDDLSDWQVDAVYYAAKRASFPEWCNVMGIELDDAPETEQPPVSNMPSKAEQEAANVFTMEALKGNKHVTIGTPQPAPPAGG